MSVAALTVKRPMDWDSPMQTVEISPNCRGHQKRFRSSASPPRFMQQHAPMSPLFHKDAASSRPPLNPDSPFDVSIPQGTSCCFSYRDEGVGWLWCLFGLLLCLLYRTVQLGLQYSCCACVNSLSGHLVNMSHPLRRSEVCKVIY